MGALLTAGTDMASPIERRRFRRRRETKPQGAIVRLSKHLTQLKVAAVSRLRLMRVVLCLPSTDMSTPTSSSSSQDRRCKNAAEDFQHRPGWPDGPDCPPEWACG